MTIQDVRDILDAEIIYGEEYLSKDVHNACGADMMSDVLAFVKDQSVLLTGLCNPHVLRTAEMMDIICIVFVRGKRATRDMVDMAKEREIALLATKDRMFTACGKLYAGGISGGGPVE